MELASSSALMSGPCYQNDESQHLCTAWLPPQQQALASRPSWWAGFALGTMPSAPTKTWISLP